MGLLLEDPLEERRLIAGGYANERLAQTRLGSVALVISLPSPRRPRARGAFFLAGRGIRV
jgi:hypothetical protein